MTYINTPIQTAKHFLENGKVVGIPTETVYGLAGNALNEDAILEIFKVKNRPFFDPLIVHTNSVERVQDYVSEFPIKAQQLAKAFWPGPLTLLLPKKSIIPDLITSGLERVAIRIPNHPLTLSLLESLDFPLAAPSANPFGYISPTSAAHVEAQLGDKISYILDGGECQVGIESTIIGFENDEIIVYRLGGVSVDEIERIVGKVIVMNHSSSNPTAPGMVKSHYAPRKRLAIVNSGTPPGQQSIVDSQQSKISSPQSNVQRPTSNVHNPTSNVHSPQSRIGFLAFQNLSNQFVIENQLVLSPSGSFEEAAKNLFAYLRLLDSMEIDVIFAELLPEIGLGRAINDRLKRAAAKD